MEGRHFRFDWSSPYEVGRKAAAANLADVAAMGGVTRAIVVGLACPPDAPLELPLALADGLRDECARVGASVVGGDMVAADVVTVAVTALGELTGPGPVTRAGARPGDVLVLAGTVGRAGTGLELLRARESGPLGAEGPAGAEGTVGPEGASGADGEVGAADGEVGAADEDDEAVAAALAAFRGPTPPYLAGPALAAAGATAMIDVSDGLLADLGHVARASGVDLEVDLDALAAAVPGVPARQLLTGGEDHGLVAAISPDAALPDGVRLIGSVHPPRDPAAPGVRVRGGLDGAGLDDILAAPPGWDHFAAARGEPARSEPARDESGPGEGA